RRLASLSLELESRSACGCVARADSVSDLSGSCWEWSMSFARRLCPVTLAVALGASASAQEQPAEAATTVSHGISTFGELKYPADFEHLDYVNPDAPKGGEMSLSWLGTFDSMNP